MITIGVDAHKRVHVTVAFDTGGREVGAWSGPNTPGSWSRLRTWAASLGEPRMWGIEGAWIYGRGLAQHLVAAGETVYEVNPRGHLSPCLSNPTFSRAGDPGSASRTTDPSVRNAIQQPITTGLTTIS